MYSCKSFRTRYLGDRQWMLLGIYRSQPPAHRASIPFLLHGASSVLNGKDASYPSAQGPLSSPTQPWQVVNTRTRRTLAFTRPRQAQPASLFRRKEASRRKRTQGLLCLDVGRFRDNIELTGPGNFELHGLPLFLTASFVQQPQHKH